MGKLDSGDSINIDNDDKAGTSRKHGLTHILRAPVTIIFGVLSLVNSKSENFCKLFNKKWANGNCEAL